jgi:hypothetical protein
VTTIIGFGYRARSGKDTAAAEIIAKRGSCNPYSATTNCLFCGGAHYDIRRYAFADALKREVNQAAVEAGGMEMLFKPNYCFPQQGYVVTLPEWVKYDPNPDMTDSMCHLGKQRLLLQWWGTEYRRAVQKDYWVNRLAEQINNDDPQVALITDVRFSNETQYVLANKGFTVRVDRPDLPPAIHQSETALEDATDWSYVLDNSGSLEQLREGAVALFDDAMVSFPFGANR